MGEELVPKAEKEEVAGQYATAVVAYLTACLVSTTSLAIFNGVDFGLDSIGFLTLVVALVALLPFIVIKLVMSRFAWENAVSHGVGGAVAAISGILLLGRWRLLNLDVILSFLVWGGLAGLIYWAARSIGRRLFKGATE